MRRVGLVSIAVVAATVAGCGGDEGAVGTAPRVGPLSAEQKRTVDRAEKAIATYCRRFGRSIARGRGVPPPAIQRPGFAATDELIAVARQSPQGVVQPGVDMRTLLGDVAENLEGSNCDQRLVERLDQGLATLPQAP